MTTRRQYRNNQHETLLQVAVDLAAREGYHRVNRLSVARAAGVSPGLILYYFQTAPELRRQVMERAVAEERLEIIAAGIAGRDAVALQAAPELRARAIASVTTC